MSAISCPHCAVTNPVDASFCETCGKALPNARSNGPRVLEKGEVATTSAGRAIQEEHLVSQAKKAAGALLAVAILQAIFATIILGTIPEAAEVDVPAAGAILYGIAIFFFILYAWARVNPLPAAIVGLVAFVSLHLVEALADPTSIARGLPVKIIIIFVLCKAIHSGIQHRRVSSSFALFRRSGRLT